jgi:hypothetical protein
MPASAVAKGRFTFAVLASLPISFKKSRKKERKKRADARRRRRRRRRSKPGIFRDI